MVEKDSTHVKPFPWARLASQAGSQDLSTGVGSSFEGQGVQSAEKHTREETSGQRLLEWLVRHSGWPRSEHISPVEITDGYCWPTSFKVLGVLFLGEVCAAFLPLKKACWVRQFRYLRVGQQYPDGFAARGRKVPPAHAAVPPRARCRLASVPVAGA
jgi:hypothetical protein